MTPLAHGKIASLLIVIAVSFCGLIIVINQIYIRDSNFKDVMKIDIPSGISLKHEVYIKNWEFIDYTYYACLLGDRDSFLRLVHLLDLERASNFNQLVILQPGGADTNWWQPPPREKQIFSMELFEIYCDRVQRDPRKSFLEETSAYYSNKTILIYRTYGKEIPKGTLSDSQDSQGQPLNSK